MSKKEFREQFIKSLEKEKLKSIAETNNPKPSSESETENDRFITEAEQIPNYRPFEPRENFTKIISKKNSVWSVGLIVSIVILLSSIVFFVFAGNKVYNEAKDKQSTTIASCQRLVSQAKSRGIETKPLNCLVDDPISEVLGKSKAEEAYEVVKSEILLELSKLQKEVILIETQYKELYQRLQEQAVVAIPEPPADNPNLKTDLNNKQDYYQELKGLETESIDKSN